MRRFTSFITGVFWGALVGSVTVLLLTPESGDELRSRISQRTETFRDEVQQAYAARVAQLEAELEDLRSQVKK
ncbi:MAG: YtxH domain-containing protein [Anaerolineales bacterium]